MPGDRDRRKTPLHLPDQKLDIDKTPVDDLTLYGLRSDLRQAVAQQAQSNRVVHGRVGSLESRINLLDQKCDGVINQLGGVKDDVSQVKTMVEVVAVKMDSVLKKHDEERQLYLHKQRVQTESEAAKGTEMIKLESVRLTSRTKILVTLFGAISAAIGAIAQYIL